jgi:hypothetical protein
MAGKSVAEVAVEIALEEAKQGVFETANNNRGPRIDEYQRAANNTLGQAWCAKFVFWCFEQASKRTGVSNPLPKIWGAGQLESWAISQKKTVTTPALGDVFIKNTATRVWSRGLRCRAAPFHRWKATPGAARRSRNAERASTL